MFIVFSNEYNLNSYLINLLIKNVQYIISIGDLFHFLKLQNTMF